MAKKYRVGMYGGKFLPLHLGHKYCIDVASEECEKVYVILFCGGADEVGITDPDLSVEKRYKRLVELSSNYDNVISVLIDVTECKYQDGSEDWDAETPLVLAQTGQMDVVYSSEPSYGEYFSRAYPWAVHRLVDPPRVIVPISATMIRNMKDKTEKDKWRI